MQRINYALELIGHPASLTGTGGNDHCQSYMDEKGRVTQERVPGQSMRLEYLCPRQQGLADNEQTGHAVMSCLQTLLVNKGYHVEFHSLFNARRSNKYTMIIRPGMQYGNVDTQLVTTQEEMLIDTLDAVSQINRQTQQDTFAQPAALQRHLQKTLDDADDRSLLQLRYVLTDQLQHFDITDAANTVSGLQDHLIADLMSIATQTPIPTGNSLRKQVYNILQPYSITRDGEFSSARVMQIALRAFDCYAGIEPNKKCANL